MQYVVPSNNKKKRDEKFSDTAIVHGAAKDAAELCEAIVAEIMRNINSSSPVTLSHSQSHCLNLHCAF